MNQSQIHKTYWRTIIWSSAPSLFEVLSDVLIQMSTECSVLSSLCLASAELQLWCQPDHQEEESRNSTEEPNLVRGTGSKGAIANNGWLEDQL